MGGNIKKLFYFLFLLFINLLLNFQTVFSQCGAGDTSPMWVKALTGTNYTVAWDGISTGLHFTRDIYGTPLPTSEVESIIRASIDNAIEVWTAAANNQGHILSMTQVTDPSFANIKVQFTNSGSPEDYGDALGSLINIASQHTWTDDPNLITNYPDLYTIMVHEMGHIFLGAGHAANTSKSVMYYSNLQVKRKLTYCDLTTTLNFYNPYYTVTVKNSFGVLVL